MIVVEIHCCYSYKKKKQKQNKERKNWKKEEEEKKKKSTVVILYVGIVIIEAFLGYILFDQLFVGGIEFQTGRERILLWLLT
jgi:FtsZ-interacting cell division protein ZipA